MKRVFRIALIVILFTVQGIPIPFSIISLVGTLMSLANIFVVNWFYPPELLLGIVAFISMALCGAYSFTYIIALVKSVRNPRLTWWCLLPLAHLVTAMLFLGLWLLSAYVIIK